MTRRRRRKSSPLPTLVAATIALCIGTAVLWIRTDGARAFTSESARRLAILRTPRTLPAVSLEASDRTRFTFETLRGHTIIVDFLYTNCPTLCVGLGDTFARLQAKLLESRRDDVRLLSIGFDLQRDTPAALAAYGESHGADPRLWTLARVVEPQDLQPLLSSFGVVVIADAYGGFTHNAALHVIDPQGRLVRILDADDVAGVVALLAPRKDS